jgi:hypothetical protein
MILKVRERERERKRERERERERNIIGMQNSAICVCSRVFEKPITRLKDN